MIYVNKIETEELGLHYTAFESDATVHVFDGMRLESLDELKSLATGELRVFLGDEEIFPEPMAVDNAREATQLLLQDYTLSTNYPPRIKAINEAVKELGNDAPAQAIYQYARRIL